MRNRIDRKSIRGFIGIALLAITSAAADCPALDPALAQTLRSEPLPPEQAIGTLEVMPGLRVELVANEPQVVDPVSATFDHSGRLWVVEMRDYPSGPPEGQPPSGKIKVLTDNDGDGYFETAVVFADGLVFPTGLTPFRDGVVATLAGQVTYLADTTGDGVCDLKEVWFTGFSEDNEQLRANHPTWTLENEIHVASGLRGGEIRTDSPRWHQKEQAISLANRDFSFSPFGGEWRSVAGNSQFGFFQDDAGRNYVCSNRNPCDLLLGEADQVGFNPLLPAPQWKVNVMPEAEASAVYPLVEAWTTSNLHAGQFTAACGVYRYQSDLLAALIGDNYFACEPTGSLVQRYRPAGASIDANVNRIGDANGDADGIVPAAVRGREGVEFLASRDPWFRPVDLFDGPDGAMYVVDMHRAVIEHPDWMPKELQSREDQRWGDTAGRIFRIVPATRSDRDAPRGVPVDFAATGPIQWVAALASENRWTRVTAARRLAETLATESADESANGPAGGVERETLINELARTSTHATPGPAFSRALWLLETVGELTAAELSPAVSHPDPGVRTQAVRLIARHLSRQRSPFDSSQTDDPSQLGHQGTAWPEASIWVRSLATDPSPVVRYQWLLEFASTADAAPVDAIAAAVWTGSAAAGAATADAIDSQADRQWIGRAISLTPVQIAPDLVRRLARGGDGDRPAEVDVLLPLVTRLGWSGSSETLSEILGEGLEAEVADRLFEGFSDGMAIGGFAWDSLTASMSPASIAELQDRLARDRDMVADAESPADRRTQSLRRVGLDRSPQTLAICERIVDEESGDLYLAAIQILRNFDAADSAQRLVDRIVELPPRSAAATVAAVVSNPKWTVPLVDALEAGRVPWGLIDPTSLGQLERHPDRGIVERIGRMRADVGREGKQELILRYADAISQSADSQAGRALFVRHCAGCHKIGEDGVAVGPDISDMRTQSPEQLLVSILDPNAAIDANYYRYAAVTTDGQLIEGLLQDSNSRSVTLRVQDGATRTIPRDEVEQLRATGLSMMPEGFENQLDPAAMRDLIGYVKRWRLLSTEIPLGQ